VLFSITQAVVSSPSAAS